MNEQLNKQNHEEKEYNIIVNSKPKKWQKDNISFEEVVTLANGVYQNLDSIAYKVLWSKGPDSGSLVEGQSVSVKNGMKFSVKNTTRA